MSSLVTNETANQVTGLTFRAGQPNRFGTFTKPMIISFRGVQVGPLITLGSRLYCTLLTDLATSTSPMFSLLDRYLIIVVALHSLRGRFSHRYALC